MYVWGLFVMPFKTCSNLVAGSNLVAVRSDHDMHNINWQIGETVKIRSENAIQVALMQKRRFLFSLDFKVAYSAQLGYTTWQSQAIT